MKTVFNFDTYRSDYRVTQCRVDDTTTLATGDLFSLMMHEANTVESYRTDLLWDVKAITEAEPGTTFAWMPRQLGTQLYELDGTAEQNEKVNDAIQCWPEIKLFILRKEKNSTAGQRWTICRLTDKSEKPAQIKKLDRESTMTATLLRARNDLYYASHNQADMNDSAKSYLKEILAMDFKTN